MVEMQGEINKVSYKDNPEALLNPEEKDSVIDTKDIRGLNQIMDTLTTNEDDSCIDDLITTIDSNFECSMQEHIPDILTGIANYFMKENFDGVLDNTTTASDIWRTDINNGEREMFLSFLTGLQKYDQDARFQHHEITITKGSVSSTIDVGIQSLVNHIESIDDTQDVPGDLFALQEGVDITDIPEELQSLVNDILTDPPKPPEKEQQETIRGLIKQGKIGEAFNQTLDLLSSIFFGSKQEAGLEEFQKYTIDYTQLSDDELQDKINRLSYKMRDTGCSVNQKIRFCYALSRAKDEKLERENPNMTVFEKLGHNIQPGDVLLMNKDGKEKGFDIKDKVSTEGLQIASNSPRTHTVLVTKVEGNSIEITHASGTAKKVLSEDLQSYLQSYKATDICVLQQPKTSRDKSIAYAKDKIGSEYDSAAAVSQALGKENNKNDKYNCGELVGDSLTTANPQHFKNLEGKTYPADFLVSDFLIPSYMTTIYS